LDPQRLTHVGLIGLTHQHLRQEVDGNEGGRQQLQLDGSL
jgi:hypothetical protein